MRIGVTLIIMSCLLAGCDRPSGSESTAIPAFDIDDSRITTSGVSAGGYMAGQLHVAHSSLFSGAGLIAAGPYYCASGSIKTGLGACMKGGDIDVEALGDYLEVQAKAGNVDTPDHLVGDAVWIFHGTRDDIIDTDVTTAASRFYTQYTDAARISVIYNIEAPHGMPTADAGVACDIVESPFLNACDYDAAGQLLQALAGPLDARRPAGGELISIPQIDGKNADMLDSALLYVPADCANGERCGVHVALHGCQQSVEFIDNAFATGAGYNEWADSNRLLVLYPQVASSKLAPLNPLGCWDWWGYTGEDYATKSGAQIVSIMATLDSLRGDAE